MNSRACHPCLEAFKAEIHCDSNISSKLRKIVGNLSWRGRDSTADVFEFDVNDTTIYIKQIQGGEHQTSQIIESQPCNERDILTGLGTGATCWPASLVMVKFLDKNWANICKQANNPESLNVIELGSGTGIVSIAASILGAQTVLCTDGSKDVVALSETNISNNKTSLGKGAVISCCYRWGEDSVDVFKKMHGHVDVILVSDCVLPMLFPIAPLVSALDNLMGMDTLCYVSYEDRYFAKYHPRDKFISLASAKGFDVKIIPISEHDEIYSAEDIEIWLVKRTKK